MKLSVALLSTRVSSRITCLLLCVGALALGSVFLNDTGILSEEALTFSQYNVPHTMQISDVHTHITLHQPIMQFIIRSGGFLYAHSIVYARLLVLFFGIWSLLLLWSISRDSMCAGAAEWVTALAAMSWFYISISVTLTSAIVTVWALLLVHRSFMKVWNAFTRKSLLVYAVMVLVGIMTTLHLRQLLFLHVLFCIGYILYTFIRKTSRAQILHYVIIAAVAGVACFGASIPPVGETPKLFPVLPALTNTLDSLWNISMWMAFPFETSRPTALPDTVVYISLGILFFMTLVTTVSACVKRRVFLIFGFLITILTVFLTHLTITADASVRAPAAFVVAFPFFLILTGTGMHICSAFLLHRGKNYKKRTLRLLFTGSGYAVAAVVLAGWTYIQYTAHRSEKFSRANRDITTTVQFLKKHVAPGDTLTVITDVPLHSSPLLRFGYIPYLNTVTNPVATESTARWNLVSRWATNRYVTQWIIDTSKNSAPLRPYAGTVYIPFALPVAAILPNSTNDFKTLSYYYAGICFAPYSDNVSRSLLDRYREMSEKSVQKSVSNGTAAVYLRTRDSFRPHRQYWRGAVNRALYSWSTLPAETFTADTYEPFVAFARNVRGAEVDTRRMVRVFRYYIENALAASNTTIVARMLEDAREWDPTNPYLYRHTAEWYAQKEPEAFERLRTLNTSARKEFEKRFNRPYVDARIALALVEKRAGEYDASLDEMYALRDYVKEEAIFPVEVGVVPTPEEKIQQEEWKTQLMRWEAQCNNLISQLLLEKGEEEKALFWQKKNLEEYFDIEYQRVAHERLAKMYYKLGRVDAVFAQYDELIRIAPTAQEKLHWRVNQAHLAVTMGETVRAYDMWQIITSRIGTLSVEERREWARDKRYQRIMRHLERRTQMDVRDAVISVLRRRATTQPENAPEYLRNAAQLYRCKLQYSLGLSTLSEAIKSSPHVFELYLDKALLNYKLLRYKDALDDFTALNEATNSLESIPFIVRDWRYRILATFADIKKPPPHHLVRNWADTHTNLFASQGEIYNHYGNLYATYGMYEDATNSYTLGIAADPDFLDNYLDLGYMYCTRSDAEAASDLLDLLDSREDFDHKNLETDWRYIELHHVSIRPYTLDEK